MPEYYNLILAIVLSLAILFLFNMLYEQPKIDQQRTAQRQGQTSQQGSIQEEPGIPSRPGTDSVTYDRQTLLNQQHAAGDRIPILTERIQGSLSRRGARFDDLILLDYSLTTDPQSTKIILLAPAQTSSSTQSRFGWSSSQTDLRLPDANTVWSVKGNGVLSTTSPVILEWDNGAGVIFEHEISLDSNYLFTVTQRVHNTLDRSLSLFTYGLISRSGTPESQGFYILHEGPIGVFDGTLYEYDYSDLKDEGQIPHQSTGGWIGITDKYWLVSLIPSSQEEVSTRFIHTTSDQFDRYQVDILGAEIMVPPGQTRESEIHLFAGAKEVHLLDSYADQYQIEHFDLAVDFGWFYFLTKPFFYILETLNRFCGNFGVAILLMTLIIKLLFYPLAARSYKAISKMKTLQPEMLKLRERFESDSKRMQTELMALYKREKVSPLSGCLPILLQVPVFFALYKVLLVTIEMRHASFFGWIQDLSAPDPTTIFNLFGLIPWDPPSFLLIGAWPLIMGGTMFLQQRLNPTPIDPIQARIFMFLPLVFTLILANFPVGLIIYWTCNNVLSIGQQWFIMRQEQKVTSP